MSIEEKAKEYAQDKALEAISAAIEQAYADGYNDGMRHMENEKLEAIKDGVEYVDLDLPSGTLWSSKCILNSTNNKLRLTYQDASKLNIPTKEQFEELCTVCFTKIINNRDFRGVRFLGTNGKSILVEFYNNNMNLPGSRPNIHFWLKDDSELNEKDSAAIEIKDNEINPDILKIFMGFSLPVILVIQKKDG